jgi:hypothetical protein
MHTITDCPICEKDFMYHQSDRHLIRQTTIIDEVVKLKMITEKLFNIAQTK